MKVSNKFTLIRALFSPLFYILYNAPLWGGGEALSRGTGFFIVPLLIIVEWTDFFDGYFARKKNEVSDLGKIFDPFADVLLNLTLFFCCTRSVNPLVHYMPGVIFIFILYREFSMLFLRAVAVGRGVAIAAKKGGKLKTVTYIVSCVAALLVESAIRFKAAFLTSDFLSVTLIIIRCLFVLSLVLSYISFFDYIKSFYKVFKGE